jgi:hypothetical protein
MVVVVAGSDLENKSWEGRDEVLNIHLRQTNLPSPLV